jgi:type II secretory pathway pseudopilin PulG
VLVILGILAAVVVVNVVGLTGRGEVESYATDERTIQLVVSTFYADNHAYSATDGGWSEASNYTSVHNYPTAIGTASALYLGNETMMGKYKVNVVMNGSDIATTDDIKAAAIWMGLLVNGPGDGTGISPVLDTMDNSAPLAGEHGPYLNPLPKSCSKYNSSSGTGTITWIVGGYNRIYGVFEQGGMWYAGFGGRYP